MTTNHIPERRNIGRELADALGLNANHINHLTIEPAGSGDLIVTVTSTMYLTDYPDDDGQHRADQLIDRIRQYRLIPITDNDVTHTR